MSRYQNAQFEAAFGTASQLPESTLPEICFSGRSNVGKSTLINKIVGRKALARVSNKPGKTVTVNFYRLSDSRLIDLPGYGYAKVPFSERTRWSDLMESYFRSGRRICQVFQLIDMRHPPTEFDLSMLEFLVRYRLPFTIILTKADKLNVAQRNERLSNIRRELSTGEAVPILPFSGVTGEGADAIREAIEAAISHE